MRVTAAGSSIKVNPQAGHSEDNRLANLMSRKQEINDLKQSYRENALKQGKSKDEIDAKMQEYDSMISQIDSEIAQVKAEQQKKAVSNDSEKARQSDRQQTHDVYEISRKGKLHAQNMMWELLSVQSDKKHVQAVQSAKDILNTEALSYKPSLAFKGNPLKFGQLQGKAQSLDRRLSDIQEEMKQSGEKMNDSSDDRDGDREKELLSEE